MGKFGLRWGVGKAAVDGLLGLASRGRRCPAVAHTVAVYASLRLRWDLRPEVGGVQLATRPSGAAFPVIPDSIPILFR